MSHADSSAALPEGLVTFLFTDVAGSTRLWETSPDQMSTALIDHDRLIEGAVATHHGQVVRPRGEGDSRFAVFARASDAVCAAAEIQRRLAAHDWPTPEPLRVRIAVHTGEADLRAGDYYGRAVNRAARLRTVAHPGQALASGSTHDIAQDTLPEVVGLRELGTVALSDLERPERVYQVVHQDMPGEFPALRRSARLRVKLPSALEPLVGRTDAVAQLTTLLLDPSARLITLVGPGGVGKTQLAVETARSLGDRFDGGVYFVPLADATDAATATYSLAAAVEVRETVDESFPHTIARSLSGGPTLLVLDNAEQVKGLDQLVSDLLGRTDLLTVVVTSRSPLRLRGERRFPVPPLAVPDTDLDGDLSADEARMYASVELFERCAQAVDPTFVVDDANAPVVVEICRRLEGSPLAIDLAAARIAIFDVIDIRDRLDQQLSLLTDGHVDLPERQRTVRATIDWSVSLLSEPARDLLLATGQLNGRFELADAQAVGPPSGDASAALVALVDSSMVQRSRTATGTVFHITEAVREYAADALAQQGQVDEVRLRLAEHLTHLLATQAPLLESARAPTALPAIRLRYEDVRAVVPWALDRGHAERVGHLLACARRYWVHDGQLTEPRHWVEQWLRAAPSGAPNRSAVALAAGVLAYLQDDSDAAGRHLLECVEAPGTPDDVAAVAIGYQGALALGAGDVGAASGLAAECSALAEQTGFYEPRSLAFSLQAVIAAVAGDTTRERDLYEQRLALARAQGDDRRVAETLNNLAEICLAEGDLAPAAEFATAAMSAAEASGRMVSRDALYTRARLDLLQGDAAAALEHAREALRLSVDLGQLFESSQCVSLIGAVLVGSGEASTGAELMAAAQHLGSSGRPLEVELEPELDRYRRSAVDALGLTSFEQVLARVSATSLEDVVTRALAE